MSDNKKKKGRQDRSKVALYDYNEVYYFKRKLIPLSDFEISCAILFAGPSRKKILQLIDEWKKHKLKTRNR